MTVVFHTLDIFDTEFSADSVEWCPVEPFCDLVACGTYQLAETAECTMTSSSHGASKRLGRIYTFRVTNGGKLKTLQRIDVPAVLDMKWMHCPDRKGRILLAVVNSIGHLQIYQLVNDQDAVTLKLIAERKVNDNDEDDNREVLALSLDWSTGRCFSDTHAANNIVVSDSRGWVSGFTLHGNDLTKDFSWQAHDYEAWIAAFDYWRTNIFYSGGDDCKFQTFDTRIGSNPVICSRLHGSGVTSIQSNSNREFILATGSYDEVLRLWDKRSLRRPISEVDLGGGIWRVKWDPFSHRHLLVACMYGGFKIVNCGNEDTPSVISEYNEHESISYGCDWSSLSKQNVSALNVLDDEVVAMTGTCSFYDHAFKLSAIYSQNKDWSL